MRPHIVRGIYKQLFESHGRQDWWPADSPFEVMVGAVLTQNTAWTNVEKAINNLKTANCLDANAIVAMPNPQLAELIRPSGYFNLKAERLKNFCVWYVEQGQFQGLQSMTTGCLRHSLLAIKGIGPETADDMLLYAFMRPVFVIDAYTRRTFSRLGLIKGDEDYEDLRHSFESVLGPDLEVFNEYHALIVRHGKLACTKKPDCGPCCLQALCPTYAESSQLQLSMTGESKP